MLSPEEKFSIIARYSILYFIVAIFFVLNSINLYVNNFSKVMPSFGIMIIFYFAVYKNVMSYFALFFFGVFSDVLMGLPLGITSLSLLVSKKMFTRITPLLSINRNMYKITLHFIIFFVIFLVVKWLITGTYFQALYSIIPLIFELFISLLFHIVLYNFFEFLNRVLVQDAD